MTPPVIYASRPGSRLSNLLREAGIRVEPYLLDDYKSLERFIISERVAVEHRTPGAFLKGIQDKSLFNGAIDLYQNYEVPVLILEGEVNFEVSGFHPQAVRGAITALPLVYGISVLSTPDIGESSALIAMIAKQEISGVPEISLIPKRKAVGLADLQRRVVEMLPGCGVATAKDLLQHFGSLESIILADEAELSGVRGIGPVKATEIFRVTHGEYLAVEAERHLEDAIAASPDLLFEPFVELVDRQHYIFSDSEGRNFIDMVFFSPSEGVIYLVELKLGKLQQDHYLQLRRYLDHASESEVIVQKLKTGSKIKGILVTIEPSSLSIKDPDVEVRVINKDPVIEILRNVRTRRMQKNH